MKLIILTLSFLCITSYILGQDSRIPKSRDLKTYKIPKNKIYHKGWIDFNKNGKKDIYEDPTAPIDSRVEDLLSQMNLNEKTCQMVSLYGYKRVLDDDLPTPLWKDKLWKDGMGAIDEHLNGFQQWGAPPSNNPFVWPASRHAWALNEVQRFFVENTRLGIPTDFTNEGIRGVEAYKATNFPTQLGLGHTWDRALIRKIGYITGREARLLGYTNVYAPILDVGRDQRWGRYEEVYGESPYLVAELGIQMTKGMQTNNQIVSTAKHFAVYSNNKGAREGMARNDPQTSPREVQNIFLYPWRRVIKEAGLLGAMCSYNDYDSEPIEGSYYWLMKILRREMGFKGYVVSDSDAVEYLYSKHSTAKNMKDAIREAVNAGLNIRCTFRSTESYVLPLRELVKEGGVSMKTIDNRVRDILRVKFQVGLFDKPYQMNLSEADKEVNSLENQKVALQASEEELVLLKNEKNILPLSKESIKTISICGPNANETNYALTHYGPLAVHVTSVLDGIRNKIGNTSKILYTKGCDLVDANWPESEILPSPLTKEEKSQIKIAVDNAKNSDVAIVVLGGGTRTCGENKSRSSLDLPGRQLDLLKAIEATGKPVILILINGRPLSINWANKYVPAILEAWYPGSQGGTAIANALFGDYNPGGKLTVTFPKTVGQIPFNFPAKSYSQVDGGTKPGEKGNMTRINGALYSFGYGLSYTTFKYSDLHFSNNNITDKEDVTITCKITNTGKYAGDEIPQLYIHQLTSSVTTYEKSLRGFERVHLNPGEIKEVSFVIHPEDLQLYNLHHEWVVEPGEFNIMIGASSEDIKLQKKLRVIEYNLTGNKNISNTSSETIKLANKIVLDHNFHTTWTGQKGDFLNFEMQADAHPSIISIYWQAINKPTQFEIQVSSGGGQFITVYKGNVSTTGKFIDYNLNKNVASDVRIKIDSGSSNISEIHLNHMKN